MYMNMFVYVYSRYGAPDAPAKPCNRTCIALYICMCVCVSIYIQST